MAMSRYAIQTTVPGTMDDVKARVVAALKANGFGVLTEIDMQRALHDKIGVDIEPYLILGACNPQAAYQALSVDREIGLLLPCNVMLRGADGQVEVSILDPEAMFSLVDPTTQQALATVPADMKQRLQQVLRDIQQA